MTEERRSRAYARRRDLREAPLPPPAPPATTQWPGPATSYGGPAAWPDGPAAWQDDAVAPGPARTEGPAGPSTQDLAVFRPEPALPARRTAAPLPHTVGRNGDRGERARAFVERWSLWAAGLGRPPRDPSGGRRYPSREGMFPPGLLIAAGLGVAGLVGLLTGVLVTAPAGGAAAAAAVTPTVTVTEQVTPPIVTETRTRTRTRTTTATVTATPTADPQPGGGGVLQPGSQGPEVAQLQQDLALLGIYQGEPNGSYDEPTRAAVQNFQARYGVTDDDPGIAGPATLDALARAVGRV